MMIKLLTDQMHNLATLTPTKSEPGSRKNRDPSRRSLLHASSANAFHLPTAKQLFYQQMEDIEIYEDHAHRKIKTSWLE